MPQYTSSEKIRSYRAQDSWIPRLKGEKNGSVRESILILLNRKSLSFLVSNLFYERNSNEFKLIPDFDPIIHS